MFRLLTDMLHLTYNHPRQFGSPAFSLSPTWIFITLPNVRRGETTRLLASCVLPFRATRLQICTISRLGIPFRENP